MKFVCQVKRQKTAESGWISLEYLLAFVPFVVKSVMNEKPAHLGDLFLEHGPFDVGF